MINYLITHSVLAIEKKVNMEGVLAIERNGGLFFLGRPTLLSWQKSWEGS